MELYSVIFKHLSCNSLELICKFSSSLSCKHKINKSNTKKKISAHYWIICLCSKNLCFYVFISYTCFSFIWNIFFSKAIKISNIIILYVQSNTTGSNIRITIKVYYICFILYFNRVAFSGSVFEWVVCRINTIKSRIIFISKLVKGWGGIKNPFCFYNLVFLLSLFDLFYFHNQL